ncbi:hypothetical protein F8M41_005095 [Gigaspora margarita]|uniref:Uncharacterized protein n=1 Tax=Gigaspora margarita TaxID=4874 RepID=A0A8H3XB96_GIGMA|nr:hypothetical protein F8M41_005095 [Gigaspora margarita]
MLEESIIDQNIDNYAMKKDNNDGRESELVDVRSVKNKKKDVNKTFRNKVIQGESEILPVRSDNKKDGSNESKAVEVNDEMIEY